MPSFESEFAGEAQLLTVWRLRSPRFRLAHRCNVLRAFLTREVSARSFWFGLRFPHCVVVLARRAPKRGMVVVCPERDAFLEGVAREMGRPAPRINDTATNKGA